MSIFTVPSKPADSLLLSARDAAKQLAISEKTLWSLSKAGRLPVVRIGRNVRYARADLLAFIDRAKGGRHGNG